MKNNNLQMFLSLIGVAPISERTKDEDFPISLRESQMLEACYNDAESFLACLLDKETIVSDIASLIFVRLKVIDTQKQTRAFINAGLRPKDDGWKIEQKDVLKKEAEMRAEEIVAVFESAEVKKKMENLLESMRKWQKLKGKQ